MNERLRELRIKSGYTQVQIAKILNIDRSTYSYYEIGKTTPDITVLMTLAKVFNIAINDLLADEGTPETVADSGAKFNFIYSKKNTSHIYELSSNEKILVGVFRSCTVQEQEKILKYLKENIKK
ncbi:helix-turn-helix domain-containing protein [Caproiciproducens sp. CPB-2]|uniref:helix-turn-helix domain-containing protein n=1 Tax=Caproiciproducens sp. CPB-2 TaxID=3030017 RepID=UPI0023DAC9A4|nr:helix-turn-helix domain-containing protein [Caproiciproducens sp. CPB-2]MDF1495998.1 helix-turn-helix domain-containing protein [Caproiciproducens sp. CPB-2]